jgi:hypothetical protein
MSDDDARDAKLNAEWNQPGTPPVVDMWSRTSVMPPPRCRVYWGSHGCDLERGHPGGPDSHDCGCCQCTAHPDPDSGCVAKAPFYGPGMRFYGEDAEALGLPLVSA